MGSGTMERTMSADLFNDLPFNLAGESLNAEHDAQQEANEKRVRALAESEARKAQTEMKWDDPQHWKGVTVGVCDQCHGGHVLKDGLCWNCRHPSPHVKVYALHDDTNENAL